MTGRICLVTGANTGIGKSAAQSLAAMGATVVLGCRSADKAAAAQADIAKQTGNQKISVLSIDLSSMASVRQAAAELRKRHDKLDVLVNNAGAWWNERKVSSEGIELQWATNVLGPHLLTQLLLPALEASGHGRIVNVASTAAGKMDVNDASWEKRPYSGMDAYSATKQANRMLTWALARRLRGKPVVANAMSPGLVRTELNRSVGGFFTVLFTLMRPFSRTPAQGADTIVYLASDPAAATLTDQFVVDRKPRPCKFRGEAAEEQLWALCERQTRGA